MSEETYPTTPNGEWPVFSIRHSYNPEGIAPGVSFEPNEVVLYDASHIKQGRWLSAKYGSYLPLTDIR